MQMIYYGRSEIKKYVSGEAFWAPSESYPEYADSELSPEPNVTYALIRDGFYALGMDALHFGKKEWNPLGDIIKPGMTVLLKPNWVLHYNNDPSHDMNCVVTHPSIIRAVLDYVLIALKGTGRIIVGDAPIQLCDFTALQRNMGYDRLWEYYKGKDVKLEVMDFRGLVAVKTAEGMKVLRDELDGITVDLAKQSMFSEWSEEKIQEIRITNYATNLMKRHHTAQKHEYLIRPEVLQADVIINLPKPKSHRKAGLTACAKNFVGACMRKEYLPHHTMGSKEENGDEYLMRSAFHALQSDLVDKVNDSSYAGRKSYLIYRGAYLFTRFAQKATGAEKYNYSEGSWYGNDTIWRTIVDLNRIMQYADKDGNLKDTQQRKIFNICDMIVSGEGEGPMRPSPKPIGTIVMGSNIWATDRFICRLVGFRCSAVRYINYLPDKKDDLLVVADNNRRTIPFESYDFDRNCYFRPTSGWRGHIEIEGNSE